MMNVARLFPVLVVPAGALLILLFMPAVVSAQGSLTPPGPPAPTLKTLQQVEPRTPIESLPFSITAGGSYYLTTNLTAGGAFSGITISAGNVTLDLNGFTLTGAAGASNGIVISAGASNIVVRQGTVRGWPQKGIDANLGQFCRFESLVVSHNGGIGLDTGNNATVQNVHTLNNNGTGIQAGNSVSIAHSLAHTNLGSGIIAGFNASVHQSRAYGNGGRGMSIRFNSVLADAVAIGNVSDGIRVERQTKLLNCTASNNDSHGIVLGEPEVLVESCMAHDNQLVGIQSTSGAHTIRHCSINANFSHGIDVGACCNLIEANSVKSNGEDGIRLENRSTVIGNLSHINGSRTNNGAGIRLDASDNRVEGNQLSSNDLGLVASAADNLIIRNHVTGSTTNYHTVGAQIIGPIITATGTITNVNPWANFSY